MPNIGPLELVIILAILLLLFGGARLAGLGKSTGRALREFKEETKGLKQDENDPQQLPPAVQAEQQPYVQQQPQQPYAQPQQQPYAQPQQQPYPQQQPGGVQDPNAEVRRDS